MSTELFTSHRGAGVIGTLLALIILGGFCLLYFLVFDKQFQGGAQTLESIIEEDARHLAKLKQRHVSNLRELEATKGHREVEKDLRSSITKRDIVVKQREGLEADLAAKSSGIRDFEQQVDQYRQAYRESARATMVGREMDELKTTDGKTYSKVKVTGIDAVRMQIRHQGGITGVPLDVLSEDLQQYLQVDENEKDRRLAAEAAVRKQRSQQADQGESLHRIRTLNHRLSELIARKKEVDRLAVLARDGVPRIQRAIYDKNDELRREEYKARSGGISNAPQVRAQIRNLESQLRDVRKKIPALQNEAGSLSARISELEAQIAEAEDELEKKDAKTGSG